jgi:hypothetical protein
MSNPSEYESAIIEKHIKDSIIGKDNTIYLQPSLLTSMIDLTKAHYGRIYPQGHGWSVLLQCTSFKWTAHVIVYTTPNSLADRVYLCKSDEDWSRRVALDDLLSRLQSNIAK